MSTQEYMKIIHFSCLPTQEIVLLSSQFRASRRYDRDSIWNLISIMSAVDEPTRHSFSGVGALRYAQSRISLHSDDHFPQGASQLSPSLKLKALSFRRALGTSLTFITPLSCRVWTLLSCAQQGRATRCSLLRSRWVGSAAMSASPDRYYIRLDFDQDQEQRNIPVGDRREGPKTIFLEGAVQILAACGCPLPWSQLSRADSTASKLHQLLRRPAVRFGPNGINSKLTGRDLETHLHQSFEPPISLRLDMC